MRIDYDISQLGNALIETSLKALGSPYGSKARKSQAEGQSQRQADGKAAQCQPKSAQQVEAGDGAGLQMVPQSALLRAQSSQKIGSTAAGPLHSLNRQDYPSPTQHSPDGHKDQDQDQRMNQNSSYASPGTAYPL